MKYASYEGPTKQEAVNRLLYAARMENRLDNTVLLNTHFEEIKKFFGLKREKKWIATAGIIEKNSDRAKKKPSLRGQDDQPELFEESSVSVTDPIPRVRQDSTSITPIPVNKRLESEVENLKTSLQQIQDFVKSEFDEIKENLIQNNRNNLDKKKRIIQDAEMSQKNIQWADDFLLEREFHPEVVKEVLDYLKSQRSDVLLNKAQIITAIREFLKSKLNSEEILIENYRNERNILLVGPTGVGKTVTIIKMAAYIAAIREKSLRFISIDRFKVGADSQLHTYAELLKSPFYPIHKQEEFFDLLNREETEFTFIDTAGRSPKDTIVINELGEWLKKSGKKFDVHLVVSATTKPKDLDLIYESHNILGYSRIIATKLDETTNLGSIVSVLYKTKKPLSFITNGQGVPEDFEIANVDKLIADSLK